VLVVLVLQQILLWQATTEATANFQRLLLRVAVVVVA
jgi:hypothetical protein